MLLYQDRLLCSLSHSLLPGSFMNLEHLCTIHSYVMMLNHIINYDIAYWCVTGNHDDHMWDSRSKFHHEGIFKTAKTSWSMTFRMYSCYSLPLSNVCYKAAVIAYR